MPKLIDPDSLNQATEVVISTGAKTIQLLVAGNLSNTSPGSASGVTLQCLYSFLKEEWKTDTALNKFKFPIKMFTKTDGIFINGWAFADATTRNLIRDAGWEEVSGNKYAGIISLGSFDATGDQAWYQNVIGYNQGTTNFNKTGNLNEAILIYNATGPVNYTGYLKNFLRIRPKLYSEYDLLKEQGLSALEPVLYRLPLSNSTDLKVVTTDIDIDTTTPYVGTADFTGTDGATTASSANFISATANFVSGDIGKLIVVPAAGADAQHRIVSITSTTVVVTDRNYTSTASTLAFTRRPKGMKLNYLKGRGFTTYANATVYPAASVVKDGTNRWFFTTAGGTSNAATRAADTGCVWVAYDGEVQIGSTYYAFNRLLVANNGTAQQIYNWAQRDLRKTVDINANDSTTVAQRSGLVQNGTVAELLLEFVGDTLKTKGGLYISGFDTNSTNSIKFRDITVDGGGVDVNTALPVTTNERAFPFVAAGSIAFSSNLVNEVDADTKYAMYFTTNPGGNFDTSSAIIVNNNAGSPITGQVTASSIAFDFDYDNNVQGGRTAGTDAAVSIVAQGLPGATWILATHTITRATGQSITVNADDERNYANPV